MILILCQEIKNGEKSRRVREGVREKTGFELDFEGQGVVSAAEGRWKAFQMEGTARDKLGVAWASACEPVGLAGCRLQEQLCLWMPAGSREDRGGQTPGSEEAEAWGGAPWQGPCRVASLLWVRPARLAS